MTEHINLAKEIEKRLPAALVSLIQTTGEMAARQGQNLYLAGGVVRDLLLRRSNFDLDLVVEGDAIKLAQQLVDIIQGKITTHLRFGTAKLKWQQWSIDLATARSETYERPGALPKVKPGALANDLFRRDFTINTMAIDLNPSRWGELIDLYGGKDDLEHKLVRILHEESFVDDATRIWRGLRYEQRLDFQLETQTLSLLKRDTPRLETISGDRLRHELELILKEEIPEKILSRAEELKVLPKLHHSLKGNGWLAEKFRQARQLSSPNQPPVELYLALLVYRMTDEETEQLISRLRLRKSLTQTLRDTNSLKSKLELLTDSKVAPSRIYYLLHGYSPIAMTANLLALDSTLARQNLELFLNKLRYVKPALTGNDLKKMGIPPGPQMKEILQRLHEARLDGKVTSKKAEEGLAQSLFRTFS